MRSLNRLPAQPRKPRSGVQGLIRKTAGHTAAASRSSPFWRSFAQKWIGVGTGSGVAILRIILTKKLEQPLLSPITECGIKSAVPWGGYKISVRPTGHALAARPGVAACCGACHYDTVWQVVRFTRQITSRLGMAVSGQKPSGPDKNGG